MLRSTETKIMKMSNIGIGSSIGGFRTPWLVPQNFNNKSPQYVMKMPLGEKPQAQVQCRFWAMGNCTNPNCKFFHGPVDENEECSYADTLVNCGVYAQNVPPTVSVDEFVALAKKHGGELYLNDPKTGSKGVKIPRSKKEDGTCAAFINFTRAKAGKAFVDFLNKNQLKGSVIRAKINSIDEIETPKKEKSPSLSTYDTSSETPKRVNMKREQVVDEDGFSVAGRNGKAKSRTVPNATPPTKQVPRPQTPEPVDLNDLVSLDELIEAKQKETEHAKEEPLPSNSGTWYSKQKLVEDNDNTGKKKKGKRNALETKKLFEGETKKLFEGETKKLFEGETEKRRARDGHYYTKQEFYDYYAMVEGVDYAYEQWQQAVRDTKVHTGLSWLGALRPDIVEMQNAEIEAWGEKLEAQYDDQQKDNESTIFETVSKTVSKTTVGEKTKLMTAASTSSSKASKLEEEDSTSYVGFIQQFEEDEYDDEVDFADDDIFSSYVNTVKNNRRIP